MEPGRAQPRRERPALAQQPRQHAPTVPKRRGVRRAMDRRLHDRRVQLRRGRVDRARLERGASQLPVDRRPRLVPDRLEGPVEERKIRRRPVAEAHGVLKEGARRDPRRRPPQRLALDRMRDERPEQVLRGVSRPPALPAAPRQALQVAVGQGEQFRVLVEDPRDALVPLRAFPYNLQRPGAPLGRPRETDRRFAFRTHWIPPGQGFASIAQGCQCVHFCQRRLRHQCHRLVPATETGNACPPSARTCGRATSPATRTTLSCITVCWTRGCSSCRNPSNPTPSPPRCVRRSRDRRQPGKEGLVRVSSHAISETEGRLRASPSSIRPSEAGNRG